MRKGLRENKSRNSARACHGRACEVEARRWAYFEGLIPPDSRQKVAPRVDLWAKSEEPEFGFSGEVRSLAVGLRFVCRKFQKGQRTENVLCPFSVGGVTFLRGALPQRVQKEVVKRATD